MEKESVQLVLDYLDKVAAKLGTTAEHVWPWFVRQQYVDAFYYSLLAILSLFMLGVVARLCGKHWKPKKGYSIYESDHEPTWIIGLVVLSGLTLFVTIVGVVEFAHIFNPEYHALKSIVAMQR